MGEMKDEEEEIYIVEEASPTPFHETTTVLTSPWDGLLNSAVKKK